MKRYSDIRARLLTFFLGGGGLLSAILFGGVYVYFVLFFCIAILTQHEFYQILKKNHYASFSTYSLCVSALLYTLSFLTSQALLNIFWLYFVPCLFLLPWIFFLFARNESPASHLMSIGVAWAGFFYTMFPFLLLHDILFSGFVDGGYTFLLFRLLLLVWSVDTFSYLFGLFFGRRTLFVSVSPKKTWEGCLGGLLGATLVSFCLSFFANEPLYQQLAWMIFAVVTTIFCVIGDLIESKIKRTLRLKDSGRLFGGHGGFLDRFDSFIFVLPIWWMIFRVGYHFGYHPFN